MRTFVAASWLNADENDYSGKQQSHMVGRMANLAAYADEESVKKVKKVKSPDFRSSNERAEDRLDARRSQFEKAFEGGLIDFERYNMLLTEWEASRAKLDKKMGFTKQQPTPATTSTKPSVINAVEDAAKGFCERHPFMFTVASILFGCGVLNLVGFGA